MEERKKKEKKNKEKKASAASDHSEGDQGASGVQTDTLFCHSFPFFAFMHKNLEQTCKFIQTVPETKAKIASLHQYSWLLKIRIYKVHSWVVGL